MAYLHPVRCLTILTMVLSLPGICVASEPTPEEVQQRLRALRHTWQEEELPVETLTLDPKQRRGDRVSREHAAEDVERLFRLFACGYSGYAFFDGDGNFARAKTRILEALGARSDWPPDALASVLREHLTFIHDCHTKIGGISYGEHQPFWFDTELTLRKVGDSYRFEADGRIWTAVSIDGEPPAALLRPSLDDEGRAAFRPGRVSSSQPEPLVLEAVGDEGRRIFRLDLRRSRFSYYTRDLFREDRIGGIPVLRIRSFSDHHAEDLQAFLETADRHRGAPCLIVDLRGNGGGNEAWVSGWIERLTGHRPRSPFIFSELTSRTTMMGRANAMASLLDRHPETDFYRREAKRFAMLAEDFGPQGRRPFWSGPYFPNTSPIPSPTTLIVVTNGLVASAGEGFVMRARRMENVVVVGENTRGALTFGNISAHRLPQSGLMVWLPINFGLFPDLVFREEHGLEPDYWVPAGDAVNRAVAAVRAGTIPTPGRTPEAWRAISFSPEDPANLAKEAAHRRWIVVGIFLLLGALWSWVQRKRPRMRISAGVLWVVVGLLWVQVGLAKSALGTDLGYGFAAAGLVCLLSTLLLRRPGVH